MTAKEGIVGPVHYGIAGLAAYFLGGAIAGLFGDPKMLHVVGIVCALSCVVTMRIVDRLLSKSDLAGWGVD